MQLRFEMSEITFILWNDRARVIQRIHFSPRPKTLHIGFGSDAVLFTSRAKFEFGPTQINKSTSNLTSRSTAVPNTVPGKLMNIISGFQNIYIIIIYALSSAHEKFGV